MSTLHSLAPAGLRRLAGDEIDPSVEYWRVVRLAVLMATSYVLWLWAVEHWVEPLVRRVAGRLLGQAIVWVPTVGPFRMWGLRDREGSAADAAVALVGHVAVIVFAVFPIALLHAAALCRPDAWVVQASTYLASLVMTSLFIVRVLVGKPEAC